MMSREGRAYHPCEDRWAVRRCRPPARGQAPNAPTAADGRLAMTVEFGLALENFTPERKQPSMGAVVDYAVTAEELGFASVWAWDHLFLGARRPFPFLESLTTLT